jgi:hypothetical protein
MPRDRCSSTRPQTRSARVRARNSTRSWRANRLSARTGHRRHPPRAGRVAPHWAARRALPDPCDELAQERRRIDVAYDGDRGVRLE